MLAKVISLWTDQRAVRLSNDEDRQGEDETGAIALVPLGPSDPTNDDSDEEGAYWNWHSHRAPRQGDKMKFG